MFQDRAHALSLEAAEETRRRIRQDRQRASAQLWPVLDHIEANLLDHRLQVQTLRESCGIGDDGIASLFAKDLGVALWDYITGRRMEVAVRLLVGSDLKVWRIGTVVGYTSGGSFGRAFKRWCGQTPGEYRAAAAERSKTDRPAPPPSQVELLGDAELRQALAGDLDEEQAAALLQRLESMREMLLASYPRLRRPAQPPTRWCWPRCASTRQLCGSSSESPWWS